MTRLMIDHDHVVGVEAVRLTTGEEVTFRGPVILAQAIRPAMFIGAGRKQGCH